MKKYFSSLLVLTLFLNNCSVLAMNREINTEVNRGQETEVEHAILEWKTGMNESGLQREIDNGDVVCQWESENYEGELPDGSGLCDDVIFYVIVPFVDNKTLLNMRLVSKKYKNELDKLVVFVYLNNFKKGRIRQEFAWDVLDFEKIKKFKEELEEKIKRQGFARMYCRYPDNKLRSRVLCQQNCKRTLFNVLKCKAPVLLRLTAGDIGFLTDMALIFGGMFLFSRVLKKFGLGRPGWIRFSFASSDSGIFRKLFSKVANIVLAAGSDRLILIGSVYIAHRITRNANANFAIRNVLQVSVSHGIGDLVTGAIHNRVRGALYGLASGLLFGGALGVSNGVISPRCQNAMIYRFGILRAGIATRYAEDVERLAKILECENDEPIE